MFAVLRVAFLVAFVCLCRLHESTAQTGCNRAPCGTNSICTAVGSTGFNCRCQTGYTSLTGRDCYDSNLCARENCGANSECIQFGREAVCQCRAGFYSASGSQRDCIDRDECIMKPCGSYSTCTNTIGSYRCRCFGGFRSDTNNNVNCHSQNQNLRCNFGHSCSSNSLCSRTSTSGTAHRCHCVKGYWAPSLKNCPDVNECLVIPNNGACSANSRCENVLGSYRCICNEGFHLDAHNRCVDIDECAQRPCGANADCLNTYGSYECQCQQGYYSLSREGSNCIVDPSAMPLTGGTAEENMNNCYTATVIAAVTACLFALIVIGAIIYLLYKRRKRSQRRKFSQGKGTFTSR